MAVEPDATSLDLGEAAYEILERSSEAADRPDRNQVELSSSDATQQSVESRPTIPALGARHTLIGMDHHDRPAEPHSDFGSTAGAGSRRSGPCRWRSAHRSRRASYPEAFMDRQTVKRKLHRKGMFAGRREVAARQGE